MEKQIRIAVVDDEKLFASALGAWLQKSSDVAIVGYAGSGDEGWTLCSRTQPDVALVDVEMPGGDGLSLARRLIEAFPDMRIIIMTGRVDPHTAWLAGRTGVHGLVDKTIEPQVFQNVVHTVAQGGSFQSPAFKQIQSDYLADPEAFQKVLTNRELAVLRYLADAWDDERIGAKLGISPQTVASHRKSLRRKIGSHDDRSLIAYGRKWGIYGAGS